MCQGMLQLLLGGFRSEAPAHDLLGSVQQIHVLRLVLAVITSIICYYLYFCPAVAHTTTSGFAQRSVVF